MNFREGLHGFVFGMQLFNHRWGLLTDCSYKKTLTTFHYCSPSQRTDLSQAVPPQTWSAPSTDVRHDTEGESLDTCYLII